MWGVGRWASKFKRWRQADVEKSWHLARCLIAITSKISLETECYYIFKKNFLVQFQNEFWWVLDLSISMKIYIEWDIWFISSSFGPWKHEFCLSLPLFHVCLVPMCWPFMAIEHSYQMNIRKVPTTSMYLMPCYYRGLAHTPEYV